MADAIDAGALTKLMEDLGGDPEVMRELVDTFLDEGPRILGTMRTAFEGADTREVNRAAHSLKSTAATFGASGLSQLCRDLEAASEKGLPAEAREQVAAIEAEWTRVLREIRAWRP